MMLSVLKTSLVFKAFSLASVLWLATSAFAESTISGVSQSSSSAQPIKSMSQAVDTHIRQALNKAGAKVDIISIAPSNLPNMYQVNLIGQLPLHITADARYVIQGELQQNPNPNTRLVRRTPTHMDSAQVGTPLNPKLPFYYTAVPGVLWSASSKGVPFLVSDDGQYITDSEIYVIENGQFMGLDEHFETRKNKFVLSTLDETQLITYPATAKQRAVIYVATDVNCPYCRKLHKQMDKLNRKGVTVKLIGYPLYEQSPRQMRDIWCQEEGTRRRKALDEAMLAGRMTPPPASCTTDYMTPNRKRAAGLAIVATPMIFREDGVLYQGNFESPEFLKFLGVK